jgi:hypothetical protein
MRCLFRRWTVSGDVLRHYRVFLSSTPGYSALVIHINLVVARLGAADAASAQSAEDEKVIVVVYPTTLCAVGADATVPLNSVSKIRYGIMGLVRWKNKQKR